MNINLNASAYLQVDHTLDLISGPGLHIDLACFESALPGPGLTRLY